MEAIGFPQTKFSIVDLFTCFNVYQTNVAFLYHDFLREKYDHVHTLALQFINRQSSPQAAVFTLAVAWILLQCLRTAYSWTYPKVSTAVHQGYRSWYEPTILVQARFLLYAKDIISDGFKKHGERPFIVRRWDNDITIFHNKYVGEICSYPNSKASALQAQIRNLGHKWNWITILGESNLFRQVLQTKLISDLPRQLQGAFDELGRTWNQHVPECEDWTEIDIHHLSHYLIAHTSSRIFVGRPACDDPTFIKLVVDYTIDIFLNAFTLRLFPAWMHPIVAPLNIFRWRVWWHITRAQKILKPIIEQHRECVKRRQAGERIDEEDTLLHWMMDHGTGKENSLWELSIRQCLMTLASIHTTSNGLSHLVFDLCTDQDYVADLRDEILQVEKELGKLGERTDVPLQAWLSRLEKLESFYVESQRFNPAILMIPQRQILTTITLKDGTKIPEGTRVAFCNADILDSTLADPEVFDPMRSYRKRHETGELQLHRAGMTNKYNLHFGYGKSACPGRHFAVAEIKMIATRLIRDYEFKFPEGKGRPRNFYLDEYVFADPRARILMRRRKEE